jgi:3-oxoacyl-[acyl-carrier protein] reductase
LNRSFQKSTFKELEMSASLKGKVAVVTGASKGIGVGIAKSLAREGATVVVNYASDRAGAESAVAEIEKAGGKAVAIGASLATEEGVDSLFAEVAKKFDRVDVLVNNAGIYAFYPLAEITAEKIRHQFDLNVTGLLLASKHAARLMGDAGGSIVNISSGIVYAPSPGASIYGGTKGAVDVITRSLAAELGPQGIRVNTVSPGPVDTEGFRTLGVGDSPQGQAMLQATPLGRFGTPDDIGDVVAFLASEDSRWITGQIIQASGGLVNA